MQAHFRRALCGAALGIALLILSLYLPVAAAPGSHEGKPGDSTKVVVDEKAGGFRRSYRLHVPRGFEGAERRPLVVALHGGVSTGAILEKQSGFSDVADEHGFFVVYPNGFGFFSLFRHWNGGLCCAKARRENLDDIGFIDRVIDRVADDYPIDPQRIYLVGYSNGGMLAYWYASVRADRLAGLGIWASSIGSFEGAKTSWQWPEPVAPLPVFIAHGKADRRLPFERPRSGADEIELWGAVGSAEAWARANGCDSEPLRRFEPGEAIEHFSWCGEGAAPVLLLGLEGWGHEWPGPQRTERRRVSEELRGFDLAARIWAFFEATSKG